MINEAFINCVVLLVLISFFYCLSLLAVNIPRSSDDIYFFFHQFDKFFLNCESLKCRLSYLPLISVWPHPKFGGRCLQILLYWIQGEVNYKSIIMVGNALMIIPVAFIGNSFDKVHAKEIFLIVATFIFCPIVNTIWPIFIVNYAFILIFAFLAFSFGIKKQYLLYGLACLLMTFSHGNGITISIIAPILILLYNIRLGELDNRTKLILPLVFIVCFALFYHNILQSPRELLTKDVSDSGSSIFNRIIFLILYIPTFLSSSITDVFFGRNFNGLRYIVSLILTLFSAFVLFKSLLTWNKKHVPLIGILIFIIGASALAGFVRGDASVLFPGIAPRYQYWSMVFLGIVCGLAYQVFDFRWFRISLVVGVLLFWSVRISMNYEHLIGDVEQRSTITANVLTRNKFESKADENKTKVFREALTSKQLYKLPKEYFSDEILIDQINVIYKNSSLKYRLVKSETNQFHNRQIISLTKSKVGTKKVVFLNDNNGSYFVAKRISKKLALRDKSFTGKISIKKKNTILFEVIAPSGVNSLIPSLKDGSNFEYLKK